MAKVNSRARTTPSHSAMYPATTLAPTFAAPLSQLPSVIARNVSYSKVENVVYAPMKPMGMRKRQFGCTTTRSVSSVAAAPRTRQPVTLTANVPHGNPTRTRA
jgi:hypothetical protein